MVQRYLLLVAIATGLAHFSRAQFGGVDTSFTTPFLPGSEIRSSAFQSDGKIILGGLLRLPNDVVVNVARLHISGELDPTFQMSIGNSQFVFQVLTYPDDRILVAGSFNSFSGHTTYNNARLLPSGEVDTTFSRSFSTADQNDEVALTPEGKILVPITIFQSQADTTLNALHRLHENGELDTTFEPGITGHANAIRMLPDGRFFLAGQALGVNGLPRGSLFRFLADGSLDTTFSFWGRETVPIIYALTAHRDGRPVFSGSDGPSNLLATCLSTGEEDTTFQFFLDEIVLRLAIDSSDAVLASGNFSTLGGEAHGGIARIGATGTIDTSFKVALSPCYAVPDFATDALGRTLLFGYSPTLCAGSMWSGILRLLPDCTPQPWYADLDGDGSGDPATLVSACAAPPQHVANDGDCDDSNPLVQGPLTWYADADGDGFGNPASSTQNCSDVPGHVLDNTDCDDSDPLRAPGVACDDGQDLTTADAYDANCVCKGTAVRVAARAFLQGPYTGGGMNGDLRSNGLLPVAEPYTALGMNPDPLIYGGDHLDLIVGSGPNAFIDWVMLELRSAANPQQLVYVRMCMLQNDGDIVETQPIGPVRFPVPPGDYYLVLKHRNHLGVMTATPLPVVADGVVHIVDFTQPGTACFGTNARVNSGGTMLLWAGNVNGGNQISYTGGGNDRDPILLAVGNTTPNNVVTGVYSLRDTNMDGAIRYVGGGNDREVILTNVGGTTPNSTRTAQLP